MLMVHLISAFVSGATSARLEDEAPLSLVDLAADAPDARSLDGTSTHFYFRHGLGASANRTWVVFMEGGSDCVDEGACQHILDHGGGTGRGAHPTWSPGQTDFVLLRDPKQNPRFWNASHVYVPYLTGDFHAGTRCKDPWLGKYHFCGHRHLEAVIDVLRGSYGLAEAEVVVLTGCSSGGMAVFRNLDWLHDKLGMELPQAKVLGIALSGFYFFQNAYTGPGAEPFTDFSAAAFKRMYTIHGAFVDAGCKAELAPQGLEWTCQQANYSHPYIQSPMFAVHDQTDAVVMVNHAGVDANPHHWGAAMRSYVDEWRSNMTLGLHAFLQGSGVRAVFSPACFEHCGVRAGSPVIGGMDVVTAVDAWLLSVTLGRNSSMWLSDNCGLLCNPTCWHSAIDI